MRILWSSFLCWCMVQAISAQPVPNQSSLTIEQIMQGDDFVGYLPENILWSPDSKTVYFSWNPDRDTLRNSYKVAVNTNKPEKVSVQEQRMMPSLRGRFNKNRTHYLYSSNGDIFLYDLSANKTLQITNTLDTEANPKFSGDENSIIFTQGNNLFAWNRKDGTLRQLTNFQSGSERREAVKAAHDQWLINDQLAHFEILRERKMEREVRKRRNEALQPDRPLPIYLDGKRVSDLTLSPDGKFVTYLLTKNARNESTKVPNYVTESGQVEEIHAREKVGSPQDTYETGIYDIERDTAYLISTKQIPGIYDKPDFLKDYHKDTTAYQDKYDRPREVVILSPIYSDDGKAVVVVRAADNKDRWIMQLDMPTGELKLLDRQRDEAWVGGPGIVGWNFSTGNIGWLPDNKRVWFQSEETGYSHLYTVDVTTGKKEQLTKGAFEIIDVQLSNDGKQFYITSNKESPFEHHFYRMPVNGGTMERLTGKAGNHEVTLSPDENWLAVRYSFSNQPWELFLMPNKPKATPVQITHSTTEAFKKYAWRQPEIVRFTAEDGAKVPARLYRPENPNGAAVVFVHGAGYLQNVHQWWSSYYREYMFHNLLADNGYTVLDIDYRGSDGYGRDWRTGIYRFMGGKDLSDHVDGAKFLVREHGVDADRIGIYGGSYGGFITLMALFTKPGVFKSGAALRSVTDWAHYNHGYTVNILNTPVEDSIAYYRSSPIYHAAGLQDNLLMLHGMVDDNVQFQDVVRLSQRLIELGKDNWELAVFPMEAHGFQEASSWTDEYKRIFKLFQETLREEKEPKPMKE